MKGSWAPGMLVLSGPHTYWPGFLWLLGQEPPDLLRLWQATVSVKRLLWEVVAGRQGLFPAFPESRGSPRRRVMAVEGIKLF